MTHNLEEAWIALYREWQERGVQLTPEELLTYKHIFIAGAVTYRSELLKCLNVTPHTEGGDDQAIAEADMLDEELDAIAEELHTDPMMQDAIVNRRPWMMH